MDAMTAKMGALMEQLQPSSEGLTLEASTTKNLQPESRYDPTTFPPLPEAPSPKGMTAPPGEYHREPQLLHIYSQSILRQVWPRTPRTPWHHTMCYKVP